MDNTGTISRPNNVGMHPDTRSVDDGIVGRSSRPFFRASPTTDELDTFIANRIGGLPELMNDLSELGRLLNDYDVATHQPALGKAREQLFSAVRSLARRGDDAIHATNQYFGNAGH